MPPPSAAILPRGLATVTSVTERLQVLSRHVGHVAVDVVNVRRWSVALPA